MDAVSMNHLVALTSRAHGVVRNRPGDEPRYGAPAVGGRLFGDCGMGEEVYLACFLL